ncbi:MFS transporter [Demequina sp.]|uniref:MFS transporter n=1 Tax=Demequina sp. TaxID=2050685 RepID=UPI003D14084D
MTSALATQRRVWGIYVAAVVVYFVAVTHRTALGVAGVEALERFNVEATGLAILSVTQVATYAAMQIPSGHLLDRFGPRTMMTAGSLVMAAGQLLLAFSDHLALAIAARILIGAGDAPIFISAGRLIAHWFPARRVPVLMQVTGLIGQAGQLATAIPVAWLLHAHGWEVTFSTLAVVGVGAAAIAFTWVRMPRPVPGSIEHERDRFWASIRLATEHVGTRLGFWSHFLPPFSANVIALLWGVPFFVTAQGLTPAQASGLLIVLTIAAMITGPIAGVLTARHPLRRTWIVLGSAIASLAAWIVLLSFSTPRPWWQLAVFCAVIGMGGPISLVGIDFARSFSSSERLGTATGFVNIGGFTSTIIGVLLVGVVLQVVSPPGATEYTLNQYRVAFASLLLVWVAGVVGVLRNRRKTREVMAAEGVVVPRIRDVVRRDTPKN